MSEADCVEIGVADGGKDVSVQVKGAVCIDLPETPTTGYRWAVVDAKPEVVALQDDRFELSGTSPGAGGVHHFRFRATGAGSTEVRLQLRRRWETSPVDEYSFRVTVRADGE